MATLVLLLQGNLLLVNSRSVTIQKNVDFKSDRKSSVIIPSLAQVIFPFSWPPKDITRLENQYDVRDIHDLFSYQFVLKFNYGFKISETGLTSWRKFFRYFFYTIKPSERYVVKNGKNCIYHSECTSCAGLYRCVANNCQCWTDETSSGEHFLRRRDHSILLQDCQERDNENSARIFYDLFLGGCSTEPPITSAPLKTVNSSFVFHRRYTSPVDSCEYLLDSVSPLSYLCNDNLECDEIVDTNFIGVCIYGICHAINVANKKQFILENKRVDCDPQELSYCREKGASYREISVADNLICNYLCDVNYKKNGLSQKQALGCYCLSIVNIKPTKIVSADKVLKKARRTMNYEIISSEKGIERPISEVYANGTLPLNYEFVSDRGSVLRRVIDELPLNYHLVL